MNRKGDVGWGTIVAIAILLFLLAMFIINFNRVSSPVSSTITCSNSGEYSCRPASEGCGSVGNREWSKFRGCMEGQVCCHIPAGTGVAPVTGGTAQPVQVEYIGPATFTAVDAQSRRTVVEHGTIPVYVNQPKDILLDVDLPPCKGCYWQYEEMHLTRAEEIVKRDPPNGPSDWLSEKDLQEKIKNISLVTDAKYIGDTLTYVLLITPNNGTRGSGTSGIQQRFTFRYKVESPVRVTPLSTDWAKSKKVVVNCDQSVGCSAIYYVIQTNSTHCAPLTAENASKATSIPTQFCLYEDGTLKSCSFATENACYSSTQSTSQSTEAMAILQTAAQSRLLKDVDMLRYTQIEQQQSSYACKLDLSVDLGAPYMHVPLNTTMNRERQEATIYLDRNFMSERYLCVYGQSEDNAQRFYTAGRPQLIKIDTVPPVATIAFSPLTKRITFQCEDDKSGCKQNYWVQYISDVTKFFPALFTTGSQSAALWCPPYESASGWRIETKREVLYTASDVRVLCLRVEDQAGNAGVTKTIVYDSYEVLAALLAEYGGN